MQLSVGSGGGTGKKNTLPSFMQPPSSSTTKKVDTYIANSSKTPVGQSVTPTKSTSSNSSTAYSKMKAIENASKSSKPASKPSTPSKTSAPSKTITSSKPSTSSSKPTSSSSSAKPKSAPVSTSAKPKTTTSISTPVSTSLPLVAPPSTSSLDAKRKAYLDSLKGSSDAYYNDQLASLGKARDEAILQQQQAYQNAVDQGQISIDEANKQFEADKKAIDQKFYQQAQATNITAYDNGIQNSMQMLGLQAGDNARQQQSVDTATSTRDQQINDIKNRLASLASTRDLNIAGINSDYGYNSSQAKAQADKMYNDGLASFNGNDYSANQSQLFNQTNSIQQHNWDVQNANQQHLWDVQNATTDFNRKVALQNMSKSISSAKKATTTPKVSSSTSNNIKSIASAYGAYQATKQNTGLDQYYKTQASLNKGSIVQKNPVLPPVSLANNQTLSPWQKMKIVMGG